METMLAFHLSGRRALHRALVELQHSNFLQEDGEPHYGTQHFVVSYEVRPLDLSCQLDASSTALT